MKPIKQSAKYAQFFQHLSAVDKTQPMMITKIQKTKFFSTITVKNASIIDIPYFAVRSAISTLFGGRTVKIRPLEEEVGLLVTISETHMPKSLGAKDFVAFSESLDGRIFLGISDFGPVTLDPGELLHASIVGMSGSGKSNFLKILISQLSRQQNTVIHVIDGKGVDFVSLEESLGGFVTTSAEEAGSLILAINAEIEARKILYRRFEQPPLSLNEYNSLQSLHSTKVPHLPRIFVFIDEFETIFQSVFGEFGCGGAFANGVDINSLRGIISQARAFGIHFIFSSQRIVPHAVVSQVGTRFQFAGSTDGDVIQESTVRINAVPLPTERGRMRALIPSLSQEPMTIQTPVLSNEESLALTEGWSAKKAVVENRGFLRLNLPADPKSMEKCRWHIRILKGDRLDIGIATEERWDNSAAKANFSPRIAAIYATEVTTNRSTIPAYNAKDKTLNETENRKDPTEHQLLFSETKRTTSKKEREEMKAIEALLRSGAVTNE